MDSDGCGDDQRWPEEMSAMKENQFGVLQRQSEGQYNQSVVGKRNGVGV